MMEIVENADVYAPGQVSLVGTVTVDSAQGTLQGKGCCGRTGSHTAALGALWRGTCDLWLVVP